MVDYENPIADINTAEHSGRLLRISSFATGEVTEISASTLITDSGRLCLPRVAIDPLQSVKTNGDTILWLPEDLIPARDEAHPEDLTNNLGFHISESHRFVGHFILPTLITPSGDQGLCLSKMLGQVEDIDKTSQGFGLWLDTQYIEHEEPTPEEIIVHKLGDLEINETAWEASDSQGKPIEFTKRELEILIYFANNQNRACTREEFLADLWGIHFAEPDNRSVDVYIRKIRNKLEEAGIEDFIETVFGVGYKVVTNKK